MATDSKFPRGPLRPDNLRAVLSEKLENEPQVLDALLTAAARGQIEQELWDLLHQAAKRDDRLAELAFAYERLGQERRMKTLPTAAQAEVFHYAAVFFGDVFGDTDGAVGYLEKVLALAPGHEGAFERLERILSAKDDRLKLRDLYAAAAAHRSDANEQVRLFRCALVLTGESDPERTISLLELIYKADPTAEGIRDTLSQRLSLMGRHADAAKLAEQALLADTHAPIEAASRMRRRLVDLYATKMHEAERAIGHIEELLRADPSDGIARKCGEELLGNRALAGRAAAALEGAYVHGGRFKEAAEMLRIQVDQLRGPKRLEAQRRLAQITFEKLGDLPMAHILYEPIVLADPGDEEARARYLKLAAALEKRPDAARVLGRLAATSRDPKQRARLHADLGDLYLALGDAKKGRATLAALLEAGGDDDAVLRAAIALASIYGEARDHRGLATVLEKLSDLEQSPAARQAAAERLAKTYETELADPKAAATAWRKLFGTRREGAALLALTQIYERLADPGALAEILEKRAQNEKNAVEARRLVFAAAAAKSEVADGRSEAIASYEKLVERYGASRETDEPLLVLLEAERRYADVATVLERLAGHVPEAERAVLYARLAQVELGRLKRPDRAFAAYRRALALDPGERSSRLAIEKLLAAPTPPVAAEQRLAAADVLEPLYRKEGAVAALARLLEVRGELASTPKARLTALAEGADLAAEAGDPRRSIELVTKGISAAAQHQVDALRGWIARVTRLTQVDVARRAAALAAALEGRTVNGPELFDLARKAGETLAEAGDVVRALAIYRLALAYDPASPALIAKVDELLKQEGSPAERIAIYRAALDDPAGKAPRGALLRSIAMILHREMGDLEGAIASFRAALAEDASDRAAFDGLLEAHEARGAWADLYEELGRGMERASPEDRSALLLRRAEIAALCGNPNDAARHYGELLASETAVSEPVLDAMEGLATTYDHIDLLERVTERRLAMAIEPNEEAAGLERLGTLKLTRRQKPKEAASLYARAAQVYEGAGDLERAVSLFERVLEVTPNDAPAALKLIELLRSLGAWEKLPKAYEIRLSGALEGEERGRVVLAFEEVAARNGSYAALLSETERALDGQLNAAQRRKLSAVRARALCAIPTRHADAASAYRALLEQDDSELDAIERAFEELLTRHEGRDLDADRRWLFAWRVERAKEGEKAAVLFTWAEAEAQQMGDQTAAAELLSRVLDVDPEHDRALLSLVRLRLDLGDVEGALYAAHARRSSRDGAARDAVNIELGELLLRAGRPVEAVEALRPSLEAPPVEPAALALVTQVLAHPRGAEAASSLAQIAATTTAMEARRAIYEALLGAPTISGAASDARVRWSLGLVEACRDEPEAALVALERALVESPGDLSLWDRAEALARDLGRPAEVSAAYRKVLADNHAELAPEVLATLGRRAVEHLEEWFDDADAVRVILRRLAIEAGDLGWAFERLKLDYASREAWTPLLDLYDAVLARQTDVDTTLSLTEEAAFAARDFAGDAARATGYFEALLPHASRRTAAVPALERLYERTGQHKKLALLLAEELTRIEKSGADAQEDAVRLRVRLSHLWLSANDPSAAVALVEPLVDETASATGVLDVLEQVFTTTGEPTPRKRAGLLLEAQFRNAGRTRDLVRVLEGLAALAEDATEGAARLREVLTLRRDGLNDAVGALDTLAALLLLEPADEGHRRALAELSDKLARPAKYAEALVLAADQSKDQDLARDLLLDAARTYETRLGDLERVVSVADRLLTRGGVEALQAVAKGLPPDLAPGRRATLLSRFAELISASHAAHGLALLREAIEADSASPAARKGLLTVVKNARENGPVSLFCEAVAALSEALTRSDDAAALAALTDDRVHAATSVEDQTQILLEAATLHTRVGDLAAAHSAALAAVQLSPASPVAAKELFRATLAARKLDALGPTIQALVERGFPKSVARDLYREIAIFQRESQGDDGAAEASLLAARDLDPKNLKVLHALSEVQRKRPDRALVETLLALSEVAGGDLEWLREATSVALDPVADRELAARVAEMLVATAEASWGNEQPSEMTTTNARLDDGWSSKLSPAEAATWGIDTLAQLRKEAGDDDAVVALHLRAAAMPFDAREKRRRRLSAAGLCEPDAAISLYLELFLEDPEDLLVRSRLETLYREEGRRGDLVALRELELSHTKDPAGRAAVRLDLAELFVADGDAKRAEALLRESRQALPEHEPTLSRLITLWESQGRFSEVVGELNDEAERRAKAGAIGADTLLARGAELAEIHDDAARAIAMHRRAVALGRDRSLGDLARLLTQTGNHAGAAEVLERLAEQAPVESVPQRALEVAEAWLAAGDTVRAVACLERAGLASHPLIRKRLIALYRTLDNPERVAELLVEEAAVTAERAQRALLLGEAGRIYLERLNDAERGAVALEQAAGYAPDDLDLVLVLGRALRIVGRLTDAERALRQVMASFGSRRPKERARLHHELARVALAEGRAKDAVAELDAALRIDPANAEVLVSLARHAEAEGDLERAARAYRSLLLVARRPDATDEGFTRGEVLLSLARIAARRNDVARARELTDSAFEAARGDTVERKRLLAVLRSDERPELRARALEMAIEVAEHAEEARILWLELAALRASFPGELPAAFDAVQRALLLEPLDANAHELAFDFAERAGLFERYIELLLRLEGDPRCELDRAELLVKRAGAEARRGQTATAILALRDAADLLLEAPAARADNASQLLAIYRRLEALHGDAGDPAAQAEALGNRADLAEASAQSPEERADPLYALASLWLADAAHRADGIATLDRAFAALPDAARAQAVLAPALEAEPNNIAALSLLERIASAAGDGPTMIRALVELSQLDPSRRADLKAAYEQALELGDAELTASLLKRVIEAHDAAPDDAWAWKALAELRSKQGDFASAAALFEGASSRAKGNEALALLAEAASLAAQKLDDLPRAARLYETLLAREPTDAAFWSPLLDAYRALHDDPRLAALLGQVMPLVDDTQRRIFAVERARVLLSIAQKNPTDRRPLDEAIGILQPVLDEQPGNTAAAEMLADIYEKDGRREELATLLRGWLDAAKDAEDAPRVVAISTRLGGILEQLDDADSALEIYHGALDWQPNAREALRAILRLSLARDDSIDLGDALTSLLEVEQGPEAEELALRLVSLRSAHGDDAGAEQALEKGFSLCPTSERLRALLVTRYTERGAWQKLAALLSTDARSRPSPEARAATYVQAAEVLRERCADLPAALARLEAALAETPTSQPILQLFVSNCSSARDPSRALPALRNAIESNPSDHVILALRGGLLSTLGRDAEALNDLERAQAESGSHTPLLIEAFERALAKPNNDAAVDRDLRLRFSGVVLEQGDVDRARSILAEQLRHDARDRDVLSKLALVEERAARWDAASATYRRLLALESGEALVETALRLATACERGGRLADARGALERARRVAPNDAETRERLRAVYVATAASRELAGMILEDAAQVSDNAERLALYTEAGRLLVESREDGERAVSALEEAHRLSSNDMALTLLLADAYVLAQRPIDATRLLTHIVDGQRGRRSRALVGVYQRIARIQLADGDLSDALRSLTFAFDCDPQNAELAMELGMLAVDLDDADIATRAFRAITLMRLPPAKEGARTSKAVAYYHLASIARAQGDARKAVLLAEKALGEDPNLNEARILITLLAGG